MERRNFEKWWSKNLFGDNKTYIHNGEEIKLPTIDEFSESWMGSINDPDRIDVRKHYKNFKSLLDVGCGGSPEYFGISNFKNLKYTGLDITPEIVEFNQKKDIDCKLGSIEDIPFESSTFDIVHTRHVLEHLKDFDMALSEMIRVAKKIVLISFFIGPIDEEKSIISLDNKNSDYEIYHNSYSKSELKNYLNHNKKVKKYKFIKLSGKSTYLLKIYIKNKRFI